MSESTNEHNRSLTSTIGKYIGLLIEDTRLSVAEKATRLVASMAFVAAVVIVSTIAMVFISLGVSMFLSEVLGPQWAFLIVSGFYVVVLVIIVAARRALFVDPIARYISRLIVTPPQNETNNDKPAPIS